MKGIIGLIIAASMAFSTGVLNVYASEDAGTRASLTVDKTVPNDPPYTSKPYRLTAVFDAGTSSKDVFTKKSWFRVDLLEDDADLTEVYAANSFKERIITARTRFQMDVTLNGTYIFCGWTGTGETPDITARADISDIETERPMAELVFTVPESPDQSVIAEARVKSIDCGKDAELKRRVLFKYTELPPGSWPESLAPDDCNAVYDQWMAETVDDFRDDGLEIPPDDNGNYQLIETGQYILFLEDSVGRYSAVWKTLQPDSLATPEPLRSPSPAPSPSPLPSSSPLPSPSQDTEQSRYPYFIESLDISDIGGEPLDAPHSGEGFIVEATVRETAERAERDQFFTAVYGTDGKLLSIDFAKVDLPAGSALSIGFYVPPQSEPVGSVKAYVWSSFDSPEPLAETAELVF